MKKKILHIQCLPKLSGVQNVSVEILKKLPDSKFEKYILFSSNGTEEQKNLIIKVFNEINTKVFFSKNLVRELSFKKDLKAFFEIKKLCKDYRFDIVHTNSSKPGVVGRIGATLAKVPLVIHTVHGTAWNKFMKFPKWLIYWAMEMVASCFCKKIVLVNEYFAKYFMLHKHKIVTIYNAIDFSTFPPKKYFSTENKINILYVGRLDEQKDPMTLLKAAKIVISNCPNANFTLVGDGEYYNGCQQFINQNGLNNNVKLEGWRDNPKEYYSQSDMFVASSIYEAFGLIFLEAGFYELPVCATNVEGIPEVVIDNKTGLLCEPRDAKKLAKNIVLLCKDKELRKTLGVAGKKQVTELFKIDEMISKYMEIYKNQ